MDDKFGIEPSVLEAPPNLDLKVDDGKLVEFIDIYTKKAKENLVKLAYNDKVDRNKRFLFGRQIDNDRYVGMVRERSIKSYEKPFIDNVIKEGEDAIRGIIFSKMPDFIVTGGESDKSEQTAERLSKVINKRISSDEIKRVLTRAFRHLPVYYTGVLKWFWNPNKGPRGDFDIACIHPKNIIFDFSITENDPQKMKVIVHLVERPLKDWIVMFPSKKEELLRYAESKNLLKGTQPESEKAMAVNLKLEEVWFKWVEEIKDENGEENEGDVEPRFDTKSGVCWKAGNDLLDKKMNPNWDWQGEEKMFLNGQPIPDEVLPQLAMLGFQVDGITTQRVFRNYLNNPPNPFILLGYDQWGEMPLDESSRIEDNLYLQENYDYRGMQVTRMIDDARTKHVFSTLSGLKKDTLEEMDLNDPDEDVVIDGDLRQVYTNITPDQPSPQMFEDLARSRERILSKVNIHGATRGEIQTSTATTNQIAREGDFTIQDNLSEDTVMRAATQIVQAYVHVMKLRYTPEHFQAILGKEGAQTLENVQYDMIEDGMEIEVFASGTDKLRREREAKEEAQLGLIDPLTYFKDTNRADPEGRAEMLFVFQNAPELYYKKFIKGEDVPDIAEQIAFINQQRLAAAQQPPQQFGQPTQAPQPAPTQPSPQNPGNVATNPQGSVRSMVGGTINRMMGR